MNDPQPRVRFLLLAIFVAVFAFLLCRTACLWSEVDAGEKAARVVELLLIAVGAWVVVWPESFPRWKSSNQTRRDEP